MKILLAAPLAAAAALAAVPAGAVPITVQSYSVTSDTANLLGDGLVINTTNIMAQSFNVGNLAVGQSASFDLFEIYTNEAILNADDLLEGEIEFTLQLSQPLPNSSPSTIGGITFGVLTGFFNAGVLSWENGGIFDIAYGPNSDGIIRVDLNDATFNECTTTSIFNFCGQQLDEGAIFGEIVDVTFTHLQEASVPAPGALGLLGLGLLGAASMRRRRAA